MTKLQSRVLPKEVFPTLAIGVTACIDWPRHQPEKRDAYQAVSTVARAVFGPSCYRMKSSKDFRDMVMVTRVNV